MKLINLIKSFFNSAFFTYGLFWSWNILFAILFVWLEVESSFIFSILKDIYYAIIPLDLALFGILAAVLPFICIVLALTVFKGKRTKLIQLFYGVEGPLLLLCLLRITVLRELTAGTSHLLLLLLIGGLFYFYGLLSSSTDKKQKKWWIYLNNAGHICMLIIGCLIAIIIAFYILPLLWMISHFVQEVLTQLTFSDFLKLGFFGFLFGLFAFFTATLFVFTPIVLPIIYGRAFKASFLLTNELVGRRSTVSFLVIFIGVNLSLYAFFNWNQPQNKAFELLSEKTKSISERSILLENEDLIRKGLLNAYLSQYRYISSLENNNHIEELYKQKIGFSDNLAEGVQDAYNLFAKAFLYEGNMFEDRQKAVELYQNFFDRPIDRYEKKAIASAIEATWDRDGVEASLLNVNEEKVLLKQQSLLVEEREHWAEVELHEVYQNQTFQRQEIFYYFSLPETAVITGLWLSDNDSIQKQYDFRVSPRGAAQQVYKEEVQRRVDPSLLEQVGPRQYRLRAFPILPKQRLYHDKKGRHVQDGPNFHLWMQYKIPKTTAEIALPRLLERRNVYWNDKTEFLLNGNESTKGDQWYPDTYRLSKKASSFKTYSQLEDSILIETKTMKLNDESKQLKNAAILIDQSYSMRKHQEALSAKLERFRKEFEQSKVDVYFENEQEQEVDLDVFLEQLKKDNNYLNYFGNEYYLSTLKSYSHTLNQRKYDLILILTDEGSYELIPDSISSINSNCPIFLLHLGNSLPAAYSDAAMETIEKSGGKSVLSIDEIINDFTFKYLQESDSTLIAYADGLLFKTESKSVENTTQDFAPIAARQFVKNSTKQLNKADRLKVMDRIHALAQSIGFVSQYSSMIVLVNERQQKALDEAELQEDRFDREIENGSANLSVPNNPLAVSGTPEPEEWMLIGIVSCLLLFTFLKGRLF